MPDSYEALLPQISLPKVAEDITGLGESLRCDPFSGASVLTVPIFTTECRNFFPQLALSYSSNSGNGPYGLGFSIALASISRQTQRFIPKYEANDIFISSEDELLVLKLDDGERISPDEAGVAWNIRTYLPRNGVAGSQIEQWTNTETYESYWRVIDENNVTSILGKTENARISNPDNPRQVVNWLIEESYDSKGNRIVYEYKQENNANVQPEIYEANRSYTANRYIHSIKYGNYFPQGVAGPEVFAFEIIFDYGEYKLDDLNQPHSDPYQPVSEWKERADPFSTYRSGFEIRTFRLCRNVLMFHHFPSKLGVLPCLVRATKLVYDQTKVSSTLVAISSVGYRRKPDGSYDRAEMPPLELTYSAFDPPEAPVFRTLKVDGRTTIPGNFDESGFQAVSLRGESLPGFLLSNQTTTLYYEPAGQGVFHAPTQPSSFPNIKDLQSESVGLGDLNANGQTDLIVSDSSVSGFYKDPGYGDWEPFQPFPHTPNVQGQGRGELVDLVGNGMADLLFVGSQDLTFYPSEGANGYTFPQRVPKQAGFPASNIYPAQITTFGDMVGDGLSHRIRFSSGQLEVWPNLGYGQFGKKIMLGNVPQLNTLVSQVYFADVDGSGTADLIFGYSDKIEIYLNQSGNSFSAPITVSLPAPLDQLDQISFMDILGHGATSLVLTTLTPSVTHWFYEFSPTHQAARTANLLIGLNNNMGEVVEIEYASTTKFYLEDKRQGKPWVTRLPFPQQVVEKLVTSDLISKTRMTSLFKYHEGYYDSYDKEFRGFGFVENWDAEEFDEYLQNVSHLRSLSGQFEKELFTAPKYTKNWFNTGAYLLSQAVSRQYEQEYFSGDPNAYDFPPTQFSEEIPLAGAETLRQAYAALKGLQIRQEVYGVDPAAPELNTVPYTVTQTNYEVRLTQPREKNKFACFSVHQLEQITYAYERVANDPGIKHDFVLEIDRFGSVEKSCTVNYGRRSSTDPDVYVYPEQSELKVVVYLGSYTQVTEGFRMIGIAFERQSCQLGGLDLKGQQYFSLEAIRSQVDEALLPANRIPYGAAFAGNKLQSQVFSWQQSYFWNLDQNAPLPLGQITQYALLHHQRYAAFSNEWLQTVYGEKISTQSLENDGGYSQDESGYWWNKGLVTYYFDSGQPGQFFLPWQQENIFAASPSADSLHQKTTVAYDEPYFLTEVETVQYLSDTIKTITVALIDYNTVSPWQTTDMNQIVKQALADPLGRVIATSIFKPVPPAIPTEGDGDLSDPQQFRVPTDPTFNAVLADPPAFLQQATAYVYYDLFAWINNSQPVNYIELVRQTHVSDLRPGQESPIEVTITYYDGLGKIAEQKREAEPGSAVMHDAAGGLLRDDHSNVIIAEAAQRWIVTGRTIYNNKGNPAAQYLPFYSDIPEYEEQLAVGSLVPPPTVTFYDPLDRVIRVRTPKGFLKLVGITAWQTTYYDEDDTVKEAPFYIEFMSTYPPDPTQAQKDEKEALDKAASFYNTPAISVVDNVNHPIRLIQNNLGNVGPDAFAEIVAGSSVTSAELWNDLILNGYLATSIEPPAGVWVTGKFQPYSPGFVLTLDPEYQQFAPQVTLLLLQNCLTIYFDPDIRGQVLQVIDPRLYYSNVTTRTSYYNFNYAYPMEATPNDNDESDDNESPVAWLIDNCDAGTRWKVLNIFGNVFGTWDSRGSYIYNTYDRLQRPLNTEVTNSQQQTTLAEVITYGEEAPNAQQNNLWGQIYQMKDQAGVVVYDQYSIELQIALTTRQFCQDYTPAPDWSASVTLQTKGYETALSYDALKRITSEKVDNGDTSRTSYFISGRPSSLQVDYSDGTVQPILTNIVYNASNEPLQLSFNNIAVVRRGYEPATLRLIALSSVRSQLSGDVVASDLQAVTYVYDPVGNLVLMRDKTQQNLFCYPQPESAGDYTYNALYRLIRSTGQEHPGIEANSHINGFKQSIYADLCPANSPEQITTIPYTEEYSYDNSSNLIQMTHQAFGPSLPPGFFTRNFPVAANSDRFSDVAYDGNGNPQWLMLNNQVALNWDYRNNLASTGEIERTEGDVSAYFVYDHAGNRVRKVIKTVDPAVVVEEQYYLGSYEVKFSSQPQISGEEQILRVLNKETCYAIINQAVENGAGEEGTGAPRVRYQLGDDLGSISVEVAEDASIISYEEYFPFGETSVIAGNSMPEVQQKFYRYSNKYCDDITGLYYYGARYIPPWAGRWLNPDPSGPVNGLNLYAFVREKPTTFTDSDGRQIEVRRIPGRRGRPDVIQIRVSGILVNDSSRAMSQADLTRYARRLARQFKSSYSGQGPTTGGSVIKFNADVDIRVSGNIKRSDHVFRFVDRGRIPGRILGTFRPRTVVGRAPLRRKVTFMNEDIADMNPAKRGRYARTGLSSTGGATLERTGTHEFGHSMGLAHPLPGTLPFNLMHQSQLGNNPGMTITPDQAVQIETDFNAGHLNQRGQV